MLVEHRGHVPVVDPSACVAPTAVLCGDVHVGADARILFGAVLAAEDGRYGQSRDASARERMERQAAWFAAHRDDRAIDQ